MVNRNQAFLGLAALIATGAVLAPASRTDAALVYALTDENKLVSFDSATPTIIGSATPITGRLNGEDLIGIDFRPANGLLYGVGDQGRIYSINTTTGLATVASVLSSPLQGSRFGIDFNPTADRLRIVSDADQNLRVNVDTGAVIIDSLLNPSPANIVAAAYTNSFPGATTTTLYTIDSLADALNIQNPPNAGTQNAVGPLGVDVSNLSGFDIDPDQNAGFAVLQNTALGISQLYRINLTSGSATLVGNVGGGDLFDGLAVAPVPEPGVLALGSIGVLGLLRRRR